MQSANPPWPCFLASFRQELNVTFGDTDHACETATTLRTCLPIREQKCATLAQRGGMNTKIRITEVVTAKAREDVYCFRYRVYVEEMNRFQMYADHLKKQVCEPLDVSGYILAAYDSNDQIVGTVRFNVGVDQGFGIYTDLYRLPSFSPFFPENVSITTKLMILPEFRRTSLALRLATACYTRGLELGTCFDFIDCNSPLVGFFEHLGYRQTVEPIEHPEYGRVVPLVLAMHDVEHLTKIGSPFAAIGRRFADKFKSVEFFHKFSSNVDLGFTFQPERRIV